MRENIDFRRADGSYGLNESEAVLRLIRRLASKGYAVILISHNMQHVFHISDRICIMRQGKVVKELKSKETSMDEVVSFITGSVLSE